MTAVQLDRPPRRRYRFADVARMEWIKLRTLRSTWWTVAVTAAGAVGIATAVGLTTKDGAEDLTNNALSGVSVGLLALGALGVLVMTGEHSSGMIRATLAAVPDRRLLLAAKGLVFGATALVAGEAAAFTAFLAGTLTLRHGLHAPGLDQPAVLRAVLLAGAGLCLVSLLGLGLGAIIRHTAPAIAAFFGVVFVAQFIHPLSQTAANYFPFSIMADSLGAVQPQANALPQWAGIGMLALYAAAALLAGGWVLARRDA